MSNLYLDEELDGVVPGERYRLTGDEARHAATVARCRVGEQIAVGNGRGLILSGSAEEVAPDHVSIIVDVVHEVEEPRPRLTLAQALAKGGRDERAVQMAVEIGATAIIPWQAERSIARWSGEKRRKGTARWRSIVREASKQAARSHLPSVAEPTTVEGLAAHADHALVLVLDPTAETPLSEIELSNHDDITVVVGPEGGLSRRELDHLSEAGCLRVALGPTVLRTSTAGPAALAVINVRSGAW